MIAKRSTVKSSNGKILCALFRPGGERSVMATGPFISDENIRVLESEGMEHVRLTERE